MQAVSYGNNLQEMPKPIFWEKEEKYHQAVIRWTCHSLLSIKKTCLYNFDPLNPHFYIVKLGFTGVYIILLISAQKHRLLVFVRTASARF